VIVILPTVVELVIVTVALPLLPVVEVAKVPPSLRANTTVWPGSGRPLSVTVAVAVLVETPLAGIEVGDSFKVIFGDGEGGGDVSVSVALPPTFAVVSVALIVADPAVVELVIVAVKVPVPLVVVPLTVTGAPEDANVTMSPVELVGSVTVAVAVLVEVPLASIERGESVTVTDVAALAATDGAAWSHQPMAEQSSTSAPMLTGRTDPRAGRRQKRS
jgi:hypothetical protein